MNHSQVHQLVRKASADSCSGLPWFHLATEPRQHAAIFLSIADRLTSENAQWKCWRPACWTWTGRARRDQELLCELDKIDIKIIKLTSSAILEHVPFTINIYQSWSMHLHDNGRPEAGDRSIDKLGPFGREMLLSLQRWNIWGHAVTQSRSSYESWITYIQYNSI